MYTNIYTTILQISIVLIGYVSTMAVMWTPKNNKWFHYASIGMWLLLSCLLAQQFGPLKMIVFIILQLVLVAGFSYEVRNFQDELLASGKCCDLSITHLLLMFLIYAYRSFGFSDRNCDSHIHQQRRRSKFGNNV